MTTNDWLFSNDWVFIAWDLTLTLWICFLAYRLGYVKGHNDAYEEATEHLDELREELDRLKEDL
jgi:hypothetical protein